MYSRPHVYDQKSHVVGFSAKLYLLLKRRIYPRVIAPEVKF